MSNIIKKVAIGPNPANEFSSFRNSDLLGDPLSFRLMLGEYNRSLYAYLRVIDENVVLRNRDSLRIDRSDNLRLALGEPGRGVRKLCDCTL